MPIGPLETDMTTQDAAPPVNERQLSTKAFYATYVVAAIVASVGWTWLLISFALALLGY